VRIAYALARSGVGDKDNDEDWGTDTMKLTDEDLSYALVRARCAALQNAPL
jgi:hypothetical protein